MGQLSGKTIAVTGAGSGIGRAIAVEIAAQGGQVILIGPGDTELVETAQLCPANRAHPVVADVRDEPALDAAFEAAPGGLDGVVANAGILLPATPVLDLALSDWDAMMSVNLTGVFLTTRCAARVMARQGRGGSIVLTGSSTASRPMPGFAAYVASKAGVAGLCKSLALELAEIGIRVNLIIPGTTETPLTRSIPGHLERIAQSMPLGAVVQPEELARAAAFLLSDQPPRMTGGEMRIDAGRSVA